MNDNNELRVPRIPGIREIVLREQAFVSLNNSSADVRVETVYQLTQIPLPPPQVTSSCDGARTWTFSGGHMTGANGQVEIHLNKFLDCVPASIEGVLSSNYIGSRPNFTATPETEEPIFLTCTIDATILQPPQGQVFLPQQALDVIVRVRSWRHDGTTAPNITFNWIAIARVVTVTNF